MLISEILSLPAFAPLHSVVPTPLNEKFLGNRGRSLYDLGDGYFLQLSQYKGPCLIQDDDAPYIVSVIWSCDLAGARRFANDDVEGDAGTVVPVPTDFWPLNGGQT